MVRIHEIKIQAQPNAGQDIHVRLIAFLEKKLRLRSEDILSMTIVKEAVDARKKPLIFRVFSLDVESVKGDEWLMKATVKAGLKAEPPLPVKKLAFSLKENAESAARPVVIGFGPCGMFAALVLALAGARPLVLERGASMEKRTRMVESFWNNGGAPDFSTNVQFGEGGAGTFSDGKLTTGTRSPYSRFVLETFVSSGASENILYRHKPHIGTDRLRHVVVEIRKKIESLGGKVRFETRAQGLEYCSLPENGGLKVTGVRLESGEIIPAEKVILAIGHSARDTVRTLASEGIYMEQKPFSMGLRIEHSQRLVDISQYGAPAQDLGLEPADYKLNVRTAGGRGVYTFCMCPGGSVINASSQEGCVVTNGMSLSARDSGRANSALLCDVRTSDYGSEDPLAGIAFQEKYEALAYRLGGGNYSLPRESLKNFVSGAGINKPLPEEEKDLSLCLPGFVSESLIEAVPLLGKKLKGFDDPDALLTGIESRSSSPVRIKRFNGSENCAAGCALTAEGLPVIGLYPAGEGAGYAGGIMSAACDGIAAAAHLIDIREEERP